LYVWDNVWNETTFISYLSSSNIHGNGGVYYGGSRYGYFYYYGMPNPVPFGQVTLKMSTYTSDGNVIINFYANGQKYDTVTITPSSPANSAIIEIAPAESYHAAPLDLELILAGYDSDVPYDILQSGIINMSLYVNMNGVWVSPPSAWTIGYSTFEKSYAQVILNGVDSITIEPGTPNNAELWSGTIIETPTGTFIATTTDLSQYAQYFEPIINFNNGTRLILKNLIINGKPANTSQLNNVPLGSLVAGYYVIKGPVGTTYTILSIVPVLIIFLLIFTIAAAAIRRRGRGGGLEALLYQAQFLSRLRVVLEL
jgi:hypothetical protein